MRYLRRGTKAWFELVRRNYYVWEGSKKHLQCLAWLKRGQYRSAARSALELRWFHRPSRQQHCLTRVIHSASHFHNPYRWTAEEDEVLKNATIASQQVNPNGRINWQDVALGCPGRTAKQCRER